VRHALESGVNMIDTAPGYGDSESRLGFALQDAPRDSYYLSTKFQPYSTDAADGLYPASDLRASLEQSLRNLRTDYVDVFYLHGVPHERFTETRAQYLSTMQKARDDGLIRAIGLTERYQTDHAT